MNRITASVLVKRCAGSPVSRLASRQLTASQKFHTASTLQSHYNDPTAAAKAQVRPPTTILDLKKLWKKNIPISVLTAHDYISGKIADASGVDMVLVGDSLSMVALGYENTNEIELDVSF